MIGLIQHNARELRERHEAIHTAYRTRSVSKENWSAWTQACEEFHSSYDRLAFPGGLKRAYELLKQRDISIVEPVIAFLEADPYFFRSGYIKADFLRALPKFPLDNQQRVRLQEVILDRLQGPRRREFRKYCNLAPYVSTALFEQKVAALTNDRNEAVARSANWVLVALRRKS